MSFANPPQEQIKSRLAQVRCFLLDMDGTFYLGNQLLDGSLDFLAAVERTGREYVFLTNNSSRSAKHYQQKLERLGVNTPLECILTSGQAAAQYLLRAYPGKRVYVMGNASLVEEVEGYGIQVDNQRPEVVLCGFDTSLSYEKLCAVCGFVRAGLPFIATHPDFNCPTETGFIPDLGAMLALIEASTGRKPDLVIGKPNGEIVRAACERTKLAPRQLAMVGDRLYTDVRTGVDHGLCGILVLTGEGTLEDIARTGVTPHLVFDRLSSMIPYL